MSTLGVVEVQGDMLVVLFSCTPESAPSLVADEPLEARWLDGGLTGDPYSDAGAILRGNRVALELRGLEPETVVQLTFSNNGYESWAEMIVGTDGRIDTRTDEARDGSYPGRG